MGSELLVAVCLAVMLIVVAAAFAAAGYYMSTATEATDGIVMAAPARSGEAAPAAAQAQALSVAAAAMPSGESGATDPMPFLVVPGTLEGTTVRAPAETELSVVGNAPGADSVDLLFVKSGSDSTGAEQAVGHAQVGADGAFDLRATFASGTVGTISVRAYASGTPIEDSASKGLITE